MERNWRASWWEWKKWMKCWLKTWENYGLGIQVPSSLHAIDGKKVEAVTDFIFLALKSLWMVTVTMKILAPWKENCDKARKHIKKQKHQFADKSLYSQSYDFSSSRIWIWELDHKEGWVQNNRCLWTVMLEKILESQLDHKEIKRVRLKGNQPWIFIWRTDAEAEVSILWPLDVKSWLIGNDLDSGKD